ncbi:hypothetical protein F4859DRAFT_470851 [Xylaria cf. heliscus]|nr:hypothetical protein F4859DRAFT_470851 [Xylaria cf. heliscus]
MCIEVYNQFADSDCQHKEYQNTFRCRLVRGDQLLDEAVYLPARPQNVPPGMSGCTVRKAIRPTTGMCRRCRRQLVYSTQHNGNGSAAVLPSNSASPARRTSENI